MLLRRTERLAIGFLNWDLFIINIKVFVKTKLILSKDYRPRQLANIMLKLAVMLKNLVDKTILILGLGREGLATYEFLRHLFPQKMLGLADQQPKEKLNSDFQQIIKHDPNIILNLGPKYLENLDSYNVIVRTPGIPLKPELLKLKTQGKLTSQTKIFFDNCTTKIIGVTGTKGKGTTSSLLYHILKLAGLPVFLAGNIGTPMLPLLEKLDKNDIVVLELSSHQLEDLDKSPHIAILLNIFPEHLDHFKTMQEYTNAKATITNYQSANDWLIYNSDDPEVNKIAGKSKAQKIAISLAEAPKINTPLIGRHNLYNVMAAIEIAKLFNVPYKEALKTFKPLPHRLEIVGKFQGIIFINDSQGTNPKATIAALNSFPNITTLIAGGYDRGGVSFEEVGKKIAEYGIKTLILFPTTGELIWKAVKKYSPTHPPLPTHFFVRNMEDAVKLAYQHTPQNTVCLLSPSSASFGIFKDYEDRGNQFKKYVKEYSNLP